MLPPSHNRNLAYEQSDTILPCVYFEARLGSQPADFGRDKKGYPDEICWKRDRHPARAVMSGGASGGDSRISRNSAHRILAGYYYRRIPIPINVRTLVCTYLP